MGVPKYIFEQTKGKLKDFSFSAEYAVENLLKEIRNGKISNIDTEMGDTIFKARRRFGGGLLVDIEYFDQQAIDKFARGYIRWADNKGFLSYNSTIPEEAKLRFEVEFDSVFGDSDGKLRYGVRIDSGGVAQELLKKKAKDSYHIQNLVAIVAEISERKGQALDGIIVTKFGRQELNDSAKRDKEKLKDAVLKFGFNAGIKSPSDYSGFYNVCLEPMIVDHEGLAGFLNKVLDSGLEVKLKFDVKEGKLGKSSASLYITREDDGKKYVGLTFSGKRAYSFTTLFGQYSNMLNENFSFLLDLPIEYEKMTINPKWSEEDEARTEALREFFDKTGQKLKTVGRGAVTGLKWGTIPVWGLPYLAGAAFNKAVISAKEDVEREELERKRFYRRLSDHFSDEYGIPQNKNWSESCVIGVSEEFLDKMKEELKEKNGSQ